MAEVWFRDDSGAVRVTPDDPLPVADAALSKRYVARRFEQVTVAATAIGFTLSTMGDVDRAIVQIETAQVRYRYDGVTVPTATVGTLADTGDLLVVDGPEALANFRAIRTGGVSAILNCTYLEVVA